jgi:lysophospholipase L1-like esterase
MLRLNARWLLLSSLCAVGSGCLSETDESAEADVEARLGALKKGQLLALGDSIAFGYSPFGDFTKEHKFKGYPEALKSEFKLENSSCPGETSASFLDATAPDNGCRSYRGAYPLHVEYGDEATQMDFALARVTSDEPKDVPTLITLNISGNDIFLVQDECAPAEDPDACFAAAAPALIGSIATNVATILGNLRAAEYTGPITYMNLYSVDYSNPSTLGFLDALNSNVSATARMFGAKIADAFGAFQEAAGSESPCDAGLLLVDPAGGCDFHPSADGQEVLAQSVLDAE